MHRAVLVQSRSRKMKASELIHSLGPMFGVELPVSEEGTAQVLFDEDAVDFQAADGQLFVMADIGSADGCEDLYGTLLIANCLGNETLGCTIGLDAERRVLMLHRIIEGDWTEHEFQNVIAQFVKALRYWKAWTAAGGRVHEASLTSLGDSALLAV